MQNHQEAIRQAMRMAQSPAGQELLRMLRQGSGQELDQAMNKAAAGDYEAAKAIVSNFMKDPRAQQLFSSMGGFHGSDGR